MLLSMETWLDRSSIERGISSKSVRDPQCLLFMRMKPLGTYETRFIFPSYIHDRYYMYTILYKSLEKPNFTEATRNKRNDNNKYVH